MRKDISDLEFFLGFSAVIYKAMLNFVSVFFSWRKIRNKYILYRLVTHTHELDSSDSMWVLFQIGVLNFCYLK